MLLERARKKTRLQEGEFIVKEFDSGHETPQGFSRGKWFVTNLRLIYEGRIKRTHATDDISFPLGQLETLEIESRGPDDLIWRAADRLLNRKTKIVCILATIEENDEKRWIPIYIAWPDIHLIDFLQTIQATCTRAGNPITIEFPQ